MQRKLKLFRFFFNQTERSRQSARECRARKKLRYQYLEELVADREKAVLSLRAELEKVKVEMWRATGRPAINVFIFFCAVPKFCIGIGCWSISR